MYVFCYCADDDDEKSKPYLFIGGEPTPAENTTDFVLYVREGERERESFD